MDVKISPKWKEWIGREFDKPYFGQLVDFVKQEYAQRRVFPPGRNIFRAFDMCDPDNLKVVIIGQDPYHGPGQAMGLSFSVPAGCKLPPSLRNMYKEMAADLGCPMPESGDLTSWAAQGVLLLNTTLTVREHAAASHAKLGWRVLTDHVVRRCLEVPQPVAFLTWGKHAIDLVDGAWKAVEAGPATASLANKHVLKSTHPSPLSANRATATLPAFMGSRPYSQVNRILEKAGEQPIDWQSVLAG